MKTLHFVIVISCIFLLFCSTAYSVSAYSHGTLDLEKTSDSTITQLEFNNSTITFEQYLNKTAYKVGEIIHVYGQLRNVGIHDVHVNYLGPATSSVLKDQNGKLVDSFGGAYVLEGGPYGNETLHPNTTTILRVWDFPRNVVGGGPWSTQVQPAKLEADEPGNYYVRSMINFKYHAGMASEPANGTITLWSKPLQITVLPEKYVQNETSSGQGVHMTASLQNTSYTKQIFAYAENHQSPDVSNAVVLAEVEIPIAVGITVGIFLFTRRPK